MAKFNIFTGNLGGGPLASIREHSIWIREGLRACGHEVSEDFNNFHPDRVNVFFEWFVPGPAGSHQRKFMEFMRGPARSYPYVIVVTEKANAGSFNQANGGTMQRWQNFCKVAPRARGLWTLVPGDEKPLSFVNKHAAYLEFGYCPALEDFGAEHTSDFGLFGSALPERGKLVADLRARGFTVDYPATILGWGAKEQRQRACRVVLSPRIWGWFPIPSGSRPARVMHTDSVCAVQRCPIMPRPQHFSPHNAEGEEFIDFAAGLLSNYRAEAKRATERYRTEMPGIGECLQRCLDAAPAAAYAHNSPGG